jgi:phenylalanyl-tRNA synthetase alpha chain
VAELRENEQKTLFALEKLKGRGLVNEIVKASGLAHAAVMRATLTLSEKELIKVHKKKQATITLTKEGKRYATEKVPERIYLEFLHSQGGESPLSETPDESLLSPHVISTALAGLIRNRWGTINQEKGNVVAKVDANTPPLAYERLLKLLDKKSPSVVDELDENLQKDTILLRKRKLAKQKEKTIQELELTEAGWKRIKKGFESISEISQLTPELVRTGGWRKVKLRRFNVKAPGAPLYPGKLHPAQQIIRRVKEIFLEMGFAEIRGPIVETAFWNFDALFQPQDHPARDMVDTFYLAQPEKGILPEKHIVEAVAKTHENGWTTGSRGWEYSWSPEEAKRLVLRTHTTAATIRYLAEHKEPPLKVFSVDRVYRNEKVDYKHLAEFHQIEGIIMDKKVTLRDLMGTLKEFYLKLGLKRVQFWPSYFPYTEPSMQSTVYVPELKSWVELCGMGIFRPEVLAPLGIKHPVLAWGGGLERLILLRLNIEDIRLLYKNDLGWIRRTPVCQR